MGSKNAGDRGETVVVQFKLIVACSVLFNDFKNNNNENNEITLLPNTTRRADFFLTTAPHCDLARFGGVLHFVSSSASPPFRCVKSPPRDRYILRRNPVSPGPYFNFFPQT